MMTMTLGQRLASATVSAIGLLGCVAVAIRPVRMQVDRQSAQATALAATSSPIADAGSATSTITKKVQRYQIDPTKVFVAGISSRGFAAVGSRINRWHEIRCRASAG
ncbi:hypothetical protein F6X40_28845 [Paraburkholderia sp. UCT31]|nr:hypothetical protein [Paraburkholderia sp. UCT31]